MVCGWLLRAVRYSQMDLPLIFVSSNSKVAREPSGLSRVILTAGMEQLIVETD